MVEGVLVQSQHNENGSLLRHAIRPIAAERWKCNAARGGPCHFNQVKQAITMQGQLKIAWKETTEISFSKKKKNSGQLFLKMLVEAGGSSGLLAPISNQISVQIPK